MATKKNGIPKQPTPAKRIRLKAGDTDADCQGKIDIQRRLRATVPDSPKFSASPTVETTFDVWSATTDKFAALHQNIIDTESILAQMYTSLAALELQYKIDRDGFLVAVEGVCQNDADVRAFGLLPAAEAKHFEAEAPGDLHFFGHALGEFSVRWPRVHGAGAYMAEQSRVYPPTEASWEKCYTGTRPSFKLTGLTPGQKISIRVMSIGTTTSAWNAPTCVIVR